MTKITDLLNQINLCNFECEGGPLENNVAFQTLVQIAKKAEDAGCPYYGQKENGVIGPCYRNDCPWCSEFA
jgi:hypothetical protein